MRCIKCKSKASVEIRRHNSAFCAPHFLDYFHNQVARNVKREGMFTHQDRILVAVSGGKDSLALWQILSETGYTTTGLHIHLGIGEYSQRSWETTQAFAKERDLELIEVDLARDYGMGVPELSKAIRRVPCSGCGLSKRYVMNREAYEQGFTVVATGHNLDDEAATLLGNVLHWQTEYMARQSPVLEATHPKLVKKVKPLFTLTERETASYALIRGIEYIEEECPNAEGARSLIYKDALNRIEAQSPGAKQSFVQGFLEKAQPLMKAEEDRVELRECVLCGQTTTSEICSFCRMWDQARRKAGVAR